LLCGVSRDEGNTRTGGREGTEVLEKTRRRKQRQENKKTRKQEDKKTRRQENKKTRKQKTQVALYREKQGATRQLADDVTVV